MCYNLGILRYTGGHMGKYSVPESIRKMKPAGTMVKRIANNYYVYEYTMVRDEDGKRKTKMGKAIGSIKEGIGFVPNSGFACDSEISTLDFGEYAITIANTAEVLNMLKVCFNPEDAVTIYLIAMIHFIQGFTYLKDMNSYYEMSILSQKYPGMKLGYDALSKLYDALGRRQKSVLQFEENLVSSCSGQIAVDGHVIPCSSTENDLAEKGYKFRLLGEEQMNLLMAYDINTGIPLLSKIYEGASVDRISIKDFTQQVNFSNTLFIVDRGFYSEENLNMFQSNGNAYIIPLGKNLKTCKSAVHSLEMHSRFMYQKGKKAAVVEYKDEIIDGYRVITYRDLNESTAEQENYLRHMALGDKAYTKEGFEKVKYYMGVTVLQTSVEDKTAQEIYGLYKRRWSIETFYNYFKNKAGYTSIHAEDYYKTQGLAFIMLVSALIHRAMENAVFKLDGKSVRDCLLDAKMVKTIKRRGAWIVCNCTPKKCALFQALNTPLKI